jgi:hypothetical protein
MLILKYTFKTGVFSRFFLLFSLLLKIGVFSLEVGSVHRGPYTTYNLWECQDSAIVRDFSAQQCSLQSFKLSR